jgi:hypothetical protein
MSKEKINLLYSILKFIIKIDSRKLNIDRVP